MSISTIPDKPEDKREKRKKLQEFHQEALDKIGSDLRFMPKMAYKPYGKKELHVAFFASEINKGDDVYLEFCSKEDVPEDPERTLYKWRFNPHFEEEYGKTEPNSQTGHHRYLVPVEELIVIKSYSETTAKIQSEIVFDELPDSSDDLPMDQMTIRDYAAIHMSRPLSKKKWLNDLITK